MVLDEVVHLLVLLLGVGWRRRGSAGAISWVLVNAELASSFGASRHLRTLVRQGWLGWRLPR